MSVNSRSNLKCAHRMYQTRLRELRVQVERLVAYASLDITYEEEALEILEKLEQEIDGIGDCISVLDYLSQQHRRGE